MVQNNDNDYRKLIIDNNIQLCIKVKKNREENQNRARWLRGNARDSHSGGRGFKSRYLPDWGFFVVFLNHQGKCWVGFSLPRYI